MFQIQKQLDLLFVSLSEIKLVFTVFYLRLVEVTIVKTQSFNVGTMICQSYDCFLINLLAMNQEQGFQPQANLCQNEIDLVRVKFSALKSICHQQNGFIC